MAGVVVVRASEHRRLYLRDVDGRPGGLGQVGNGTDVVVVRVRDEDSGDAHFHPRNLQAKVVRVVARVDHDRLRCASLRPYDVAIRADRPELVTVDGEGHCG